MVVALCQSKIFFIDIFRLMVCALLENCCVDSKVNSGQSYLDYLYTFYNTLAESLNSVCVVF